jgi:hypothetical protein
MTPDPPTDVERDARITFTPVAEPFYRVVAKRETDETR